MNKFRVTLDDDFDGSFNTLLNGNQEVRRLRPSLQDTKNNLLQNCISGIFNAKDLVNHTAVIAAFDRCSTWQRMYLQHSSPSTLLSYLKRYLQADGEVSAQFMGCFNALARKHKTVAPHRWYENAGSYCR